MISKYDRANAFIVINNKTTFLDREYGFAPSWCLKFHKLVVCAFSKATYFYIYDERDPMLTNATFNVGTMQNENKKEYKDIGLDHWKLSNILLEFYRDSVAYYSPFMDNYYHYYHGIMMALLLYRYRANFIIYNKESNILPLFHTSNLNECSMKDIYKIKYIHNPNSIKYDLYDKKIKELVNKFYSDYNLTISNVKKFSM